MAKFYGNVGYSERVKTKPGIWDDVIIEKSYAGDTIKVVSRNQQTEEVNDDISLSENISIVADPYANQNFLNIKYVVYLGIKWKVTSVEPIYPRLLLTVGGVYNG